MAIWLQTGVDEAVLAFLLRVGGADTSAPAPWLLAGLGLPCSTAAGSAPWKICLNGYVLYRETWEKFAAYVATEPIKSAISRLFLEVLASRVSRMPRGEYPKDLLTFISESPAFCDKIEALPKLLTVYFECGVDLGPLLDSLDPGILRAACAEINWGQLRLETARILHRLGVDMQPVFDRREWSLSAETCLFLANINYRLPEKLAFGALNFLFAAQQWEQWRALAKAAGLSPETLCEHYAKHPQRAAIEWLARSGTLTRSGWPEPA